ncbi:hypothetical protein EA462_07305 [Natrarchaeobius halalkaliphilus]|uniref:Uncharacterized protein n=1 Tax=Natrarchaeobius halalkaliphilus TaxID=1679091 RepID=A0A3N6LLQ4_9EURY|nr:hypothetical protein [Natrarchaeobius halalkaliphilus]RQG89818.1 hypothetical protein EA462_07305 [Natrarchaeobius halalkaliphilus]
MKWRCTWCGKPHEENDPPCDECGHNAFERAVVRAGKEPRNSPARTVDTGTPYVWRCSNCGRDHVKNNPPCSRCGNPELEKTEQTYADVDRDLETPSWLEVAKPYMPIFAVIGIVAVLFATGIVSPTIIPGIGSPAPPDAPGEGTQAAGIDLEVTANEVHERLESERATSGEPREYDGALAAYAEYQNRAFVSVEYEDERPGLADPGEFGADCHGEPIGGQLSLDGPTIQEYADEADLADDITDRLLVSSIGDDVRDGYDGEGIDVHVGPGGDVYVYYATC